MIVKNISKECGSLRFTGFSESQHILSLTSDELTNKVTVVNICSQHNNGIDSIATNTILNQHFYDGPLSQWKHVLFRL